MMMIRIGLDNNQKVKVINHYINTHEISNVIIFSGDKFFMDIKDINHNKVRQIEYSETIMYRTFYPLLEEINDTYLLVMNECMRTQNRSDLHYNCIAKYTNQTTNRVVFEYFPFIEDEKDFMILLDFANSQKYKGLSLKDINLSLEDIECVRKNFILNTLNIEVNDKIENEYKKEVEKLLNNLGNKSPDTVPRHIHIWTGKFKKSLISGDNVYVARNSRFKLNNVVTYKDVEENVDYIMVDIQHRRLDFNDFLRKTKQENLKYISTNLKIDTVYIDSFKEWNERLKKFYDKTSIYQ